MIPELASDTALDIALLDTVLLRCNISSNSTSETWDDMESILQKDKFHFIVIITLVIKQ